MKKASKFTSLAEQAAVYRMNERKEKGEKMYIITSPGNITVDYLHIASTFDGFARFCVKHGFTYNDFGNWPFTYNLHGEKLR